MEDRPVPPEADAVKEMQRADAEFTETLSRDYPPQDRSESSQCSTRPGDYWGAALAVACAELGLPIGFGKDQETEVQIYGSNATMNYWLNLTGFELRDVDNIPDNESRSGIFTILNHPVHSVLFEHMYAACLAEPVETVMGSDPMLGISRIGQVAALYELIDHEGFQRLYQEDPERCIRLYLARQLPHLQYLRKTIQTMELGISLGEASFAENPGVIKEDGVIISPAGRREQLELQRNRVKHWQTNYDLSLGLLSGGHKPYSLEDIIPIAKSYTATLLATHPELNPTDLKVHIPDARTKVSRLLTELGRRGNAAQN